MERKINNKNKIPTPIKPNSMNPKKEYLRLVIGLVILAIIIGAFLLYLSMPYLSSKSIILSTRPVDPFDPIRGQYMIINYEINTIPEVKDAQAGDTIYIILKEDDRGIHRYNSISLSKPNEGEFIKGTLQNSRRVEYGIEQYFFERNARFETRISNVRVKLTDSGRPAIVELLDENLNPIKINYKNKTLTT
jgi:uncharacterized membrane-anchored protein